MFSVIQNDTVGITSNVSSFSIVFLIGTGWEQSTNPEFSIHITSLSRTFWINCRVPIPSRDQLLSNAWVSTLPSTPAPYRMVMGWWTAHQLLWWKHSMSTSKPDGPVECTHQPANSVEWFAASYPSGFTCPCSACTACMPRSRLELGSWFWF